MIDITHEHLIPVRDVPRKLPPRPNGRRIHISAVYRWIQRGVRGVRLESVRIGGTTYTSEEAMQRYAEQLNAPGSTNPGPQKFVTSATRQKQIDRAARQVDAILGIVRDNRNQA